MTFYNDRGFGACGTPIDASSQFLVAVSFQWWTTANPNNDPLCRGVSVQVTFNGNTITVPVEDKCPTCTADHIDLSQPAFAALAPLSAGVIDGITWQSRWRWRHRDHRRHRDHQDHRDHGRYREHWESYR